MTAEIEQKLIDKKINPTAMRLLVLDFLVQQSAALSLSDIEKGLAPADRITIYRTLKTFEEQGLIHSIEDGTGAPKFAICADDCDADGHHDLHLHFYCSECNETYCMPTTKIPKVTLPEKFTVKEVNLVVKGLCDKCSD